MANDKLDPTEPSGDYLANQASMAVLRTVMAGTQALRDAGEAYLPKHPAEEQTEYDTRKAETVLTNRLEQAVAQAVGKPMAVPVTLVAGSGYDPFYDLMVDDVDFLGNSLDVFARNFLEDGVTAGLAYILVDMPAALPGMTLADEIANNVRPYFIHFRAEDVLSCTITVDRGRPMVIDARLKVDTVKVVGFKEYPVRRVKHWRADGWDLWEEPVGDDGKAGDWSIVASGPNTLQEVTLVPFFAGKRLRKTGFAVKPPFVDLAWKNVEHFQSSSDQRHILKYSRFPILAGAGVKKSALVGKNGRYEPVVIGPQAVLLTDDPQGKWYYVEPSGAAIGGGFKDLERLEAEMAALAMKPHNGGTGGEVTATSVKAEERRENSAIKNMALNLKDALEQAFVFAEKLRGAADATRAPSVNVNTEFDDDVAEDATSIDALLKVRVAGEISRPTFYAELQRRGHLSGSFDADAEQVLLDGEGSGMGTEDDDPAANENAPPVEDAA